MAEVSASRSGPAPSSSENSGSGVQVQKTEFKRNFFIKSPDTTGASTPESGKSGETAEAPKSSDKVEFRTETRGEMATFLDNYVTNIKDVWGQPGGRDILKAQPHAEDIFKLIAGEDGKRTDDEISANIQRILDKPEGWVVTKELLDQQTALQLFALGLASSAEGNNDSLNPADLLGKQGKKGVKSWPGRAGNAVKNFPKKHPVIASSVGGGAVGGGVGFGAGEILTDPNVISALKDFAVNVGTNIADFATDKPVQIALATALGAAGAYVGARLGGHFSGNGEGGNGDIVGKDFQISSKALDSIKSDAKLVRYMKATTGVDVSDYSVGADGKLSVAENGGTTANVRMIVEGMKSNLVTRENFYTDLGVPKGDRNVMPEQFLIQGGNSERTGERIQQRILDKFRELHGDKDQWGQTPDHPEYRRKGPSEEPTVDSFLEDPWGQGPDSPAFFRADAARYPNLPGYDRGNVKIAERKIGRNWGKKEKEQAPDMWLQRPKLRDGSPNPFYGKANGRDYILRDPNTGAPYSGTYDVVAMLNDQIKQEDIMFGPGAVDKWGQKPGDPGFGREKLKGKIFKKDRREAFSTEKIQDPPADAEDTFDQKNGTLWFATGKDGDNLVLPQFDSRLIQPDGLDVFGQDNTNKYYGRMNGTFAQRDADLSDQPDVNQYLLRAKPDAPDQWGQMPKNADGSINFAYGRGNRLGALPDVDEATPLSSTGEDAFGQKEFYADGTPNPFFRRANEEDYPSFQASNFRSENIIDLWGQSQYYEDGTPNPYFGKIDQSFVGQQQWENIKDDYVRDIFGQERSSPFFGRQDGDNVAAFDINNITDRAMVDKYGQTAYYGDGITKNPYFGKLDQRMVTGIPPEVSLANFDPSDIIDTQGRRFGHPLFGRDIQTTLLQHIDLQADLDAADVIKDLNDNSPMDWEFWTDDRPLPDIDMSMFNAATGTDSAGRPPGHPLFCRPATAKDFSGMTPAELRTNFKTDKWGQDASSVTFGIRPEDELTPLAGGSLEEMRKAREMVMADMTEELIIRLREMPGGSTARINEKIAERTEEDGRLFKKKKEDAEKGLPILREQDAFLQERKTAVETYEESQKELKEAEEGLPKFIKDTFGADLTLEEVRQRIRAIRRDGKHKFRNAAGVEETITYENLNVTFEGTTVDISPIEEKRRAARKKYNDEAQELLRENPRNDEEPLEVYKDRIKTLDATNKESLNAELAAANADNKVLTDIEAKIAEFEKTAKEKKDALDPKGTEARERHNAVYSRHEQYRERSWNLVDAYPDILTMDPNTLLEQINAQYEATKGTTGEIGWPKVDNDDIVNKNILNYAMIVSQARKDDPDAVSNYRASNDVVKDIVIAGVTQEQIELMTVDELKDAIRGKTTRTDLEIETAHRDVKRYAESVGYAIKDLQESTDRRVRRTERVAADVDFKDEVKQLEIARDLKGRQGAIFGSTAEFMADISSRIPLEGKDLLTFSGQKDTAIAGYSTEEAAYALKHGDLPVGYFEMLNVLFDYQGKSNRGEYFGKISEVFTPTQMYGFMKESLENTSLPPSTAGTNLNTLLFNLQNEIQSGMVTRRDLRRAFASIIDTIEAKALALP